MTRVWLLWALSAYLAEIGPSLALPLSPSTNISWNATKALIAFGDSYTYVQGTHGHQNYSFIGDLFTLGFTSDTLLSNEIVQNETSTAEGGPNWVEHLTGCGLEPGLTSPLSCEKELWDFAFAGADISQQYTPLHHNFTVPLVNQTQQFLTYANPTLQPRLEDSNPLVVFWIGINDIGDSADYAAVIASFPTFYDNLTTIWFRDAVQPIHDAGYQRFLFLTLPPLDRRPGNAGSSDPRPNATMVAQWNEALASHTAAFNAQNPAATALLFDANAYLTSVLDNAAQYGFSNTTGYCAAYDQLGVDSDPAQFGCLPLDQYFWFNSGHMSVHVHRLLAGAVKDFLNDGY